MRSPEWLGGLLILTLNLKLTCDLNSLCPQTSQVFTETLHLHYAYSPAFNTPGLGSFNPFSVS